MKKQIDWDEYKKEEAFSIEHLKRINYKRDNVKNLVFKIIHKAFIVCEYWNIDKPDNIIYGNNYYLDDWALRQCCLHADPSRLANLNLPTEKPEKLGAKLIFAMLIIDREDDKIKILEVPFTAWEKIGRIGKDKTGKSTGPDFRLSHDGTYFRIDGLDTILFKQEDKERIMPMFRKDKVDRVEPLHHFYKKSRFLGIEDILKKLELIPFSRKI